MQATTRDTFTALRRTYRTAKKLNAAAGTVREGQQAVFAKFAAARALRTFTGQWDLFDAGHPRHAWSTGERVHAPNGRILWRGYVTNTAMAFFRRV